MLVNPRLGSRRCSGIWPPSNPRFWLNPVPACCPLLPRVDVLPCPDPMPRPTRRRARFWPAGGFNVLRFIGLLHHHQQMRNFLHHAAKRRGIRPFNDLVDFAQSERPHNLLVLLGGADRTAYQFDFDFAFHIRHILSSVKPRISATRFLSRSCSSALIVAFTTLCGLCVPIDFVSTLGIPAACTTARTGPPAMTPVPSAAGFSSTIPLP